jgi:hypothetical protein
LIVYCSQGKFGERLYKFLNRIEGCKDVSSFERYSSFNLVVIRFSVEIVFIFMQIMKYKRLETALVLLKCFDLYSFLTEEEAHLISIIGVSDDVKSCADITKL